MYPKCMYRLAYAIKIDIWLSNKKEYLSLSLSLSIYIYIITWCMMYFLMESQIFVGKTTEINSLIIPLLS